MKPKRLTMRCTNVGGISLVALLWEVSMGAALNACEKSTQWLKAIAP